MAVDDKAQPMLNPFGRPLQTAGYRPIWRADGKLDKSDMYLRDGMSGRDNIYERPREMRFYTAPGRFDESEKGSETMAIIEIGPGEGYDGPTASIVLSTFEMEILTGLLTDLYDRQESDKLDRIHKRSEEEADMQSNVVETPASQVQEAPIQPELFEMEGI